MADRFLAADWSTLITGSPILAGAIASFDCNVTQVMRVGTHDVLVCKVQALVCNDNTHGLICFDRHYHQLKRQEA